jgi:hypothetical protein
MEKRLFCHKYPHVLALISLCLLLFVLSACAVVGPKSLRMGRADYNEAINRTEDEQMLLSIVKGRYGETFSLLAVGGVAANVRFAAKAGTEIGFGPNENYDGNLVPFSAGLAYEENPTITYKPVQGEQYLRQFLSPIPLDILLLAVRSMTSGDHLFTLLVNRINDLRNPDFLDGPPAEPDPRFMRFVELLTELRRAAVLDLVRDPRKEVAFDILIGGYAPQYSQKVREFLDLLDLQVPADESDDIVIPAYLAVKTKEMWGIGITTRSTLDLIEILRAAVEVPQEHAGAGLAIRYPPMGWAGQGLRILSSKERPTEMSMAVKFRGYWFYIDETDQRTKAFFRVLRAFWSVSISAAADEKAAPVLTIPVSR